MLRTPLLVAGVIVLTSACGTPATPGDPYATFRQQLEAGRTCPQLFQLRNELAPNSPVLEAMNEDLRSIGCYSTTSIRQVPDAAVATLPSALPDRAHTSRIPTFTVREYRAYRAVIDSPMTVSEGEAVRRAAREFGMSSTDVTAAIRKVQEVLSTNRWFAPANTEIRHASDWTNGTTVSAP